MKSIKFRLMMSMARLGMTFPLHYSIVSNIGMVVILFGLLLFCGIEGAEDAEQQLCLSCAVIIAGLCLSGKMVFDITK